MSKDKNKKKQGEVEPLNDAQLDQVNGGEDITGAHLKKTFH